MKIKTDSNGFILSIGSGLTDYDHTYDGDADIEPADPSKVAEAWNWNNGSPEIQSTGNNIPPEPQGAIREIRAYYTSINSGDKRAGRIQLNEFLSAYPGAQSALQAGDYDELTGDDGYFDIAKDDTDLADFDNDMKADLTDILNGKESYL